jgi:hypothetical protein
MMHEAEDGKKVSRIGHCYTAASFRALGTADEL